MPPNGKIDPKMLEKWRAAVEHKKVVMEDILRLKAQLAEAIKLKEKLVLENEAVIAERGLLADRYLHLLELKKQREQSRLIGAPKPARKRRATEGSGPAERLRKL
uniref:PKcGMP_CC domain-containing protein n=1 Tax=Steinernema glaseri TaxID=37863 RepID=A0A1I8AR28_9BILA